MNFVPTTPGQIPLSDISAWIFEGSTSMTTMDVDFNAAIAPGPQVFFVARWFNPAHDPGRSVIPSAPTCRAGW